MARIIIVLILSVNLIVLFGVLLSDYIFNKEFLVSEDLAIKAVLQQARINHYKLPDRLISWLFFKNHFPCKLKCFEPNDGLKTLKVSGPLSCLEVFTRMDFNELQESFLDKFTRPSGLKIAVIASLVTNVASLAFAMTMPQENSNAVKTEDDAEKGNKGKKIQGCAAFPKLEPRFNKWQLNVRGGTLKVYLDVNSKDVQPLMSVSEDFYYTPIVSKERKLFIANCNRFQVLINQTQVWAELGTYGNGERTVISYSCAKHLGLLDRIQMQDNKQNKSIHDLDFVLMPAMKQVRMDFTIIHDGHVEIVSLGRDFLIKYGVFQQFTKCGSYIIFPYCEEELREDIPKMQFDTLVNKRGFGPLAKIQISQQKRNYVDEHFLSRNGRKLSTRELLFPFIFKKLCKSFTLKTIPGKKKTNPVPLCVRRGVAGTGVDIVLGTSFLQAARATICYRRNTMIIKGGKNIYTEIRMHGPPAPTPAHPSPQQKEDRVIKR